MNRRILLGGLLLAAWVLIGCTRPQPRAPTPVVNAVIAASPSAAPLGIAPPPDCPLPAGSRDARLSAALQAVLPNPRFVVAAGASPALLCALRARGVEVFEHDRNVKRGPDDLWLRRHVDGFIYAADGRRDAWSLTGTSAEPLIVTWTDDEPYWRRNDFHHVLTPMGNRVWEHIAIRDTSERQKDQTRRLVAQGLWPSNPGFEILGQNEDGSRQVRAFGFVRTSEPFQEDGYKSSPSVAPVGGHFELADLEAPANVRRQLDSLVPIVRRSMTGPSRVLADNQRLTMRGAVGTCSGRSRVTGAAVIVRGRARWGDWKPIVEVEALETSMVVETWMRLLPRYEATISATTAALERHDVPSALRAVRRFRADLRAAYGSWTEQLEVGVFVRLLEGALERRSSADAAMAMAMRCFQSIEELLLDRALAKLDTL